MKQYDNTNRGVLFENDKQGIENRPDHTGSLNVNGIEYKLSAWKKLSKTGNSFLSISVQPKDGLRAPPPATRKPTAPPVEAFVDDEQIPF